MSQIPKFSEETLSQLAYHYKEILNLLGEDPNGIPNNLMPLFA